MKNFLLYTMICMSGVTTLFAQQENAEKTTDDEKSRFQGIRIDFEQDFLLKFIGLPQWNNDQNYTQGLGISVLLRHIEDFQTCFFPYRKEKYQNNFPLSQELSLNIAAFTPDDLRSKAPVRGDSEVA